MPKKREGAKVIKLNTKDFSYTDIFNKIDIHLKYGQTDVPNTVLKITEVA
jgi:hypothetical protein